MIRDSSMEIRLIGVTRLLEILASEGQRLAEDRAGIGRMQRLVDALSNWADQHRSSIAAAFLSLHDSTLMFVVIQQADEMDLALMDALSQLDLDILDGQLVPQGMPFETTLLPRVSPENLASFLGATHQPMVG